MDILLPQLQTFLQGQVSFVRDLDIRLIPNPTAIPESVGFPYIGLKDGSVIFHELMDDTQDVELNVEIYIYDWLDRIGKNLLQLHSKCREVRELLQKHCPSENITSVVPISEIPVALSSTPKGLVIRKGLKFKYEREDR